METIQTLVELEHIKQSSRLTAFCYSEHPIFYKGYKGLPDMTPWGSGQIIATCWKYHLIITVTPSTQS